MGVGDAKVLVKPLPGGKKRPVCPHPEVPLAHSSGGVASRFQHLSDGGLIQGKATPGARVQHPRVHTGAGLIAASQQGCPEKPPQQRREEIRSTVSILFYSIIRSVTLL